jgi:hypothetical protein
MIVDREFPTSIQTTTAIFAVEGMIRPDGKIRDHTWRENFKLRSGTHEHAKTPQVHVDMEVLLDGGSKGGINGDDDASKRWRKTIQRHIKDSLALLRTRIDESMQGKTSESGPSGETHKKQEKSGKDNSSSQKKKDKKSQKRAKAK